MQIEKLDPKTRGCKYPWESDGLSYHSRWSFKKHIKEIECRISRKILPLPIKTCSKAQRTWELSAFAKEGISCYNKIQASLHQALNKQFIHICEEQKNSVVVYSTHFPPKNEGCNGTFCARYSHTSCKFECGLEIALHASNCVPW